MNWFATTEVPVSVLASVAVGGSGEGRGRRTGVGVGEEEEEEDEEEEDQLDGDGDDDDDASRVRKSHRRVSGAEEAEWKKREELEEVFRRIEEAEREVVRRFVGA